MKKLSIIFAALAIGAISSGQEEATQDGVKSFKSIAKQIQVEGSISFASQALPFKYNSTELTSELARRQLVEIARALQTDELRESKFVIEGHTCDLGSNEYNQELSKRRAKAIQSLLAKAGIVSARIQIVGKGEVEPAVPNTNSTNRAKNRRVEIVKL